MSEKEKSKTILINETLLILLAINLLKCKIDFISMRIRLNWEELLLEIIITNFATLA